MQARATIRKSHIRPDPGGALVILLLCALLLSALAGGYYLADSSSAWRIPPAEPTHITLNLKR
jgi:hypothetical protein